MKPGLHLGVPMADYLALPAVSASIVSTLVEQCPRAAWFGSWLNPEKPSVDDSTTESRAGIVAHSILLEGNADCVQLVDAKDWRTAAAKDAKAAAIAAGKVPLLTHQLPPILAMVEAARDFIESLRDTEPGIWKAFQPGGGESEAVMVWEDRSGVLCRARPDRISADRSIIVDVKTGGTTAEPDAWAKQMVRMGYHVSAAFYRRGAEALFGKAPAYVFLVQEQEAPYLCSLVGIEPAGLDLAARKVDRGLRQWAACVRSNRWSGYPNRVCYAELPVWETAREEAAAERHAIPYDVAKVGWDKAKLGFDREHEPI